AVARREGRADELLERGVDEREALVHGTGLEHLDPQPVRVLERALLERACEELRVGVEPEIAALMEAELGAAGAEEVERRAAGLDVHRLPPGRARAARVELRGRVDAREVDVRDRDVAHAEASERPRDARADDAAASDQDGAVGHEAKASAGG